MEMGIESVRDLLDYFPRGYLDRSSIVRIGDLVNHVDKGRQVTVIGEVFRQEGRRARRSNRMMFFMTLKDESGFLACVWFEGFKWYKDAFEIGETLAMSAVPTLDRLGRPQFAHPQFDRLKSVEEDEPDWGRMFNTGAIIPKYRSSAELSKIGLDSRGFRRIIRNALASPRSSVAESLSAEIIRKHRFVPLAEAIQNIHFPADLASLHAATDRLKFDELFFLQLMLAMRKTGLVQKPGIPFKTESPLARRLVKSLPFELTKAQRTVLREIANDMGAPRPMNRLLQGDVGSGKTIVAALSALVAIDNGYQVAFMAPTEVLAEQHYRTLSAYLSGLPVNVRLLIGGQKKKLREDILEDIRSGGAALVVGTHALIETKVNFHKLGLVIIDEQHRFGVLQRATLQQKGLMPDVLVMTATPIPRTLAMTLYGDLDISTIDELPANRVPIKTAVRTEGQKQKVYEFVQSEVREGRQAYIVFPLIEESEKLDLKAAAKEFGLLQKKIFPSASLGLLHGRMKSEEKDDVMSRFKAGKIQILVSTTVIEVGIDIPNASVMIIENAERFGLSQLHQLRGRVGRGAAQSYCILISNAQLYAKSLKGLDPDELEQEELNAKTRLETMVGTNDGFKIAEVDLRLRGPGDFFGIKQSGLPGLRLANLVEDVELVSNARTDAFELIALDPQLRDPANVSIRQRFESHYKNLIGLGDIS